MSELSSERREEMLAVVLAASPGTPTLTCRKITDALAPLVVGWLEEERRASAYVNHEGGYIEGFEAARTLFERSNDAS